MCDQGRVRVSPRRRNRPCLSPSPAPGAFVLLQKQSFFSSDPVGNELLFVHNLHLCPWQDCAGSGELLIDSTLISSTMLAAVNKDQILGKVVN